MQLYRFLSSKLYNTTRSRAAKCGRDSLHREYESDKDARRAAAPRVRKRLKQFDAEEDRRELYPD